MRIHFMPEQKNDLEALTRSSSDTWLLHFCIKVWENASYFPMADEVQEHIQSLGNRFLTQTMDQVLRSHDRANVEKPK